MISRFIIEVLNVGVHTYSNEYKKLVKKGAKSSKNKLMGLSGILKQANEYRKLVGVI